jgi:hypothetical protein
MFPNGPCCGADLEIISAVLDPEQISRYRWYALSATTPSRHQKMKVLCDDWCQEAVKVSTWH